MKNSLRRIFALALVVMMIASLGMSAFAAEGDPVESITFTKNLDKTNAENAYAPATTYTFTIAPGTADTANSVFAGVAGGAKFANAKENTNGTVLEIVSNPAVDGKDAWTKTGTIEFDPSVFTHPGIYRYTVTESGSTYAGLVNDTTVRTLDVCVVEYTSTKEVEGETVTETARKVTAVQLYYTKTTTQGEETKTETVKDNIFTNTYTTTTLTVSKATTGNLAEKNREFSFTIKIDGVEGEMYHVVHSGGDTVNAIKSGEPTTIYLKDGENVIIYGLSATDEYTITEDSSCATDGYKTTVSVNGATATAGYKGEGEIAETPAPATVAVNNHREANVPTGIAMTVLPFVAMLAMAAVVAILFFRKKERREA